nr:MAG TPA: hypothetical protein [Microviridae sp.]
MHRRASLLDINAQGDTTKKTLTKPFFCAILWSQRRKDEVIL